MLDHDDLLDPFFAAIERGDIDAVAPMYADDVAVWHNVSGRALDKARSLDLLRYWTEHVQDVRYEVLERHPFEGGIVQRHIVRGGCGRHADRGQRLHRVPRRRAARSPRSSSTSTPQPSAPCSPDGSARPS